ncbi:hypothetical protein N9224_01235 [Akkermansiaceae bacterium]|nr:hypothetical protein [Akkermansiaceae bacterium]
MKTIVILAGAGISAESGIQTFRGDGGLWEGERVAGVATPEGFARNRKKFSDFIMNADLTYSLGSSRTMATVPSPDLSVSSKGKLF